MSFNTNNHCNPFSIGIFYSNGELVVVWNLNAYAFKWTLHHRLYDATK